MAEAKEAETIRKAEKMAEESIELIYAIWNAHQVPEVIRQNRAEAKTAPEKEAGKKTTAKESRREAGT